MAVTCLLAAFLWLAGPAASQEPPTVRVGLEATGTFSWVIRAMRHYGIDREVGVRIAATTYPTKSAKELALRAGQVDLVVDDFLGVLRWREQQIPVRAIYAYSSAAGGVVVPRDSDIRSIRDLKGKTLAVPNLRDKNLLILRALSVSRYGFDPQVVGGTIAAAPPLMEELLARGKLDAVIAPWHILARMVGSGKYRELIMTSEMLGELGLPTDLPALVVAAKDGTHPDALRNFLRGMLAATLRMQDDQAFWDLILAEELYSLPDRSLFPAVVDRWQRGIPEVWSQDVVDDLARLVQAMLGLAGSEVLGVQGFQAEAFTTALNP